ncbi:MAG: DUF3450 family protein [Spirochaetes bacterium]|nr:DUF3450 family protein [Spirochaetota bacterium]
MKPMNPRTRPLAACLALLCALGAQPSARQQIEALKAKIKETGERSLEDRLAFERFMKDKKLVLEQKTREKASVDDDVAKLEMKNTVSRQRARELQYGIDRIVADEKAVNERIRGRVEGLLARIVSGIPFERDRRASVMQGLAGDAKSGSSTAVESLNRLAAFLDAEDLLSYDSQVIQSIEQVDQERLNAQLLRIGRVFFAVDTGPDVFLYRRGTNGYAIDTKTGLSIGQKRDIRQAILVIQGKQAPDLIEIPLWQEALTVRKPAPEAKP